MLTVVGIGEEGIVRQDRLSEISSGVVCPGRLVCAGLAAHRPACTPLPRVVRQGCGDAIRIDNCLRQAAAGVRRYLCLMIQRVCDRSESAGAVVAELRLVAVRRRCGRKEVVRPGICPGARLSAG